MVAPNQVKCTPICPELSKDTKSVAWKHPGLGDLGLRNKTKQNKLTYLGSHQPTNQSSGQNV